MHVTFLVYRLQRDRLLSTEFYRQDIEILRSLGFEVTIATKLREIPKQTDLVFLWWWSWLFLVGPVLKLRGLPICVTGSLEPDAYEIRSWVYQRLIKWGMRFADRSIFVSRYMIERLSGLMPLKDPLYCPHIVMDEYQPAEPTNTRVLPHVIFNVAWKNLANMQRKMLPQLIDAFAIVKKEVPHARLVLAGEPMDGQVLLEEQARRLGVSESIDFLGKIDKVTKINYMQNCGAYYQCSQSEGFGVAIAEAMACGAPVVVNRKTAIPEVVGDCGYYVENETPASIAASLIHALRNPEEARQIGQQAAARVDTEFRFDRRREFLESVLSDLMKKPLPSSRSARLTPTGHASRELSKAA